MALQNSDLLPLYRVDDSSNRKISVADFSTYVQENADHLPKPGREGTFAIVENAAGDISYIEIIDGAIVSDTPPSGSQGDLWFNTTDGRLYIFYDDGNTQQWVDASPPGATGVVKLDDEGTQQDIIGGGGLSVLGGITSQFGTDAAQLGNIAPLNDWSVYPARS